MRDETEDEKLERELQIAAVRAGHSNPAELVRTMLANPGRWEFTVDLGKIGVRENGQTRELRDALRTVAGEVRSADAQARWANDQAARAAMGEALRQRGALPMPPPDAADPPAPAEPTAGQFMTSAIGGKAWP